MTLVTLALWLAAALAPFAWTASGPLLSAEDRDGDRYHALKDPSVVYENGAWHLFCTLRGKQRSHQIEYLSFKDWSDTAHARRVTLKMVSGYFCAPQVFYFRPHKRWYLLYQVAEPSRTPVLQPAYSTTTKLDDPASWSAPKLLVANPQRGVTNWIDFWTICDSVQCHLFFTTLNGKMWRSDTSLAAFPDGWDPPRVVLEGDIFEASHTYYLKGRNQYLTFVEAQSPGGRRFFRAYQAPSLTAAWTEVPPVFAAPSNVTFPGAVWTTSFSHGELLRESNDETLAVNPGQLRLLIQGVSDAERTGRNYGQIPWRLGLLTAAR
jgi:hypothetical protein